MDEFPQSRRVTIRLTPFQARALSKLRTHGLTEGQAPRTATQVLVEALLKEARSIDDSPSTSTHESEPASIETPHEAPVMQ